MEILAQNCKEVNTNRRNGRVKTPSDDGSTSFFDSFFGVSIGHIIKSLFLVPTGVYSQICKSYKVKYIKILS